MSRPPAPTMPDLAAAHSVLRQRLDEDVRYDESAAARAIRVTHWLNDNHLQPSTPAAGVAELATILAVAVVRFDVARDAAHSRRLALVAVETWLQRTDWRLMASQRASNDLERALAAVGPASQAQPDPVLDWARAWMQQSVVDAALRSVAALLGVEHRSEPVRCFIACAMSACDEGDLARLLAFSETLAGLLSERGVLCYQPIVVHDPRVSRVVSDNPYNRTLNARQLATSDLVFVVADRPATGLGVVDTLAIGYGARVVVLTGDGPVTPMITGTTPPPTVHPFSRASTDWLADFLDRLMPDLAREAALRARSQEEAEGELAVLRQRLEGLDDSDLAAAPTVRMTTARFHQLLDDPDLYDGATRRELRELDRLIPSPPPPLTIDQARTLFHAELEVGWDSALTARIELEGRRVLASGEHLRAEGETDGFWLRIYRSVRDQP